MGSTLVQGGGRVLIVLLLLAVVFISAFNSTQNKGKDRVRNVTVEVINSTAVYVRWLSPRSAVTCPISRYIVRGKYEGDAASAAEWVPGNITTILMPGIRPGAKFMVRLVAVSCRGKTLPSRWIRVRTMEPAGGPEALARTVRSEAVMAETMTPSKPTRVRTRTLTDSILLSWEPPDESTLVRGYMVGYGEGVPDVHWQYVDAHARSFNIAHLKPGSQYVISLCAYNNMGKGHVVYDLIYTREDMGPTVGPLTAPIGLKSRVLSARTVWLEWTDPSLGRAQKVTDDRYYLVTYIEMPMGESRSVTAKALNVVLYDLTPAMTYEFRVKTRKDDEETAYGISVYNTTQEDAPSSPPRSLTVMPSNDSLTSVSISWLPPDEPNGVLNGFLIFYAPEGQEGDWTIEGVLGDVFSITLDGFKSLTYNFKIQARNGKGYGPMSDIVTYRRDSFNGPEAAPHSVTVRPANTSLSAIYVTWAPPRATNHSVAEYSVSSQETQPELDDAWRINRVPGNQHHVTLEGFRPDVKYDFRVQARHGERYGPQSATVTYRRDDIVNTKSPYTEVYTDPARPVGLVLQEDLREEAFSYRSDAAHSPSDMMLNDVHHGEGYGKSTDEQPNKFIKAESSPPAVRTLVRHRVSAVLTWDSSDDVTLKQAEYVITYARDSHASVMTQRSHTPLFLLENLHPGTKYTYTITMRDSDDDEELWRREGSLSTGTRLH